MIAPTPVGTYVPSGNWSSSGSKSASVTVNAGDRLVVIAGAENGASAIGTPTMTGVTWELKTSTGSTNTQAQVRIWVGTATSSGTYTLTASCSVSWGFEVLRFSGSDGFGNAASEQVTATGDTGSVVLASGSDNSAIAVVITDWDAVDGSGRTWRSVGTAPTELAYYRNSSTYTAYASLYEDVGSAGDKTVGLSTPAIAGGGQFAVAAVEILGTSVVPENGGAANLGLVLTVAAEGHRDSAGSSDVPLALTIAASGDAPDIPPTTGSAAFALGLAIAATGEAPAIQSDGSAAFSLALVIAATGEAPAAAGASEWGTYDDTLTDASAEGTASFSLSLALSASGEAPEILASDWGVFDVTLVDPSEGTANFPLNLVLVVVGSNSEPVNAIRVWLHETQEWVPATFRRFDGSWI